MQVVNAMRIECCYTYESFAPILYDMADHSVHDKGKVQDNHFIAYRTEIGLLNVVCIVVPMRI